MRTCSALATGRRLIILAVLVIATTAALVISSTGYPTERRTISADSSIADLGLFEVLEGLPPAISHPYFDSEVRDADLLHLYIFFTYRDCLAGLADIEYWTTLKTRFESSISVIGVTSGDNIHGIRFFLDQRSVGVPVLYDEHNKLFALLPKLGLSITPTLLLVGPDGRLLDARRGQYGSAEAQVRYTKFLSDVLEEQ